MRVSIVSVYLFIFSTSVCSVFLVLTLNNVADMDSHSVFFFLYKGLLITKHNHEARMYFFWS